MNPNIDDRYWMAFARQAGEAGTCRVMVGAILVQRNFVIGMGRVGSVHGDEHCRDVGCWLEPVAHRGSSETGLSCVRTVHAEVNAVINSRRVDWSAIACYCTHCPCFECLKVLVQFGVKRVVFERPYKDTFRDKWLGKVSAIVEMVQLEQDEVQS
jgi:dCMP deaminase